jgi:cytochrome c oxidase subunit III
MTTETVRDSAPMVAESRQVVAEHFNTFEQQHEAAHLGMWIFLATEVMLFGGLFTAYTVYRTLYPIGFAEGSRHLDLTLGGVNTIALLVSSFTMALAVDAARLGHRRHLVILLAATAMLGLAFMGIKTVEYVSHWSDGMVPGLNWQYAGPRASEVQLFMLAYFSMTGLHAIHLSIAIMIVLIMLVTNVLPLVQEKVRPGRLTTATSPAHPANRREQRLLPLRHTPVEVLGLYWHFVDIVWVFLLPLLYLFGLNG